MMTTEERITIERVIGIIEGLSYTADKNIADGLLNAVEILDNLTARETGD